ncbi:unnamed protein product [Ceratitis capitata]|uniref:(Mediterranean fruit fly) hypothetical protein n=1 Tax=Ceratitis capitata TaxID=7213 RepID=A0A811UXJ7_CERCA|nr:unnamed protein product [Ceratitis capitata]
MLLTSFNCDECVATSRTQWIQQIPSRVTEARKGNLRKQAKNLNLAMNFGDLAAAAATTGVECRTPQQDVKDKRCVPASSMTMLTMRRSSNKLIKADQQPTAHVML